MILKATRKLNFLGNPEEKLVNSLYMSILPNYYPGDYDKIKDSIKDRGMDFPIVVWKTDVANWRAMHEENSDIISPPEDIHGKINLVMCGNNRLRYAKQNEYKYIDALVYEDRRRVSIACSEMRKRWREEK